jgi:thioredoxin 1
VAPAGETNWSFCRKKEFDEFIVNEKGIAVLDAFAEWCGPCKMISPAVGKYVSWSTVEDIRTCIDISARFSKKYTDARFYKFDVDAVPDLAHELSIRAMPTFTIFKDGELLKTVVGANPKALEAAIAELAPKAEEEEKSKA